MIREPVIPDTRHMSPARRARLTLALGGICGRLDCSVTVGLELDHIIALDLGGKDHDENFQLLCDTHHKAKTKLDIKLIAKGRRLRKSEAGEKRATRPIPSKPFNSKGLQPMGRLKKLALAQRRGA